MVGWHLPIDGHGGLQLAMDRDASAASIGLQESYDDQLNWVVYLQEAIIRRKMGTVFFY